jgi:hypothetical protein
MLQTAPDIKAPPDKPVIDIMLAAMAGAMRSLLGLGHPRRRSANRESNSRSSVSRTWPPQLVNAIKPIHAPAGCLVASAKTGAASVFLVKPGNGLLSFDNNGASSQDLAKKKQIRQ